jgi:alkylhydroperoxidase/carboxymuconolactone decarboxylase family protein YurZ
MSELTTPEQFARGRDAMTKVYGTELLPHSVQSGTSPFTDETVGHLFADIWLRPGLSIRDRRLLVLGATAMLGRADLIEVQTFGALVNGELTKGEMDEILLQLAFYAGWGNATSVQKGFSAALTRFDEINWPK